MTTLYQTTMSRISSPSMYDQDQGLWFHVDLPKPPDNRSWVLVTTALDHVRHYLFHTWKLENELGGHGGIG